MYAETQKIPGLLRNSLFWTQTPNNIDLNINIIGPSAV